MKANNLKSPVEFSKRKHRILNYFLFFCIFMFLIVIVKSAPPQFFGISGYIYKNGGGQAPVGTHFKVYNSNTSDEWKGATKYNFAPGYYSIVINGSLNDNITVFAWNETNYGEESFLLSGDTEKDVYLNLTRNVELNLTILNDNFITNITDLFIFNVSVTALGNSALNCNLTVFYNNSVIQTNYNLKNLGILSRGSTKYITWNFTSNHTGYSDIKVNYTCQNDGVKLETSGYDEIKNIQVVDVIPPIIKLVFPQHETYLNYSDVTLFYNVSDSSGIENCTLNMNPSYTDTDYNVENNDENNFSSYFDDGIYLWNITCFDNSPNNNMNYSETRKFYVDTTSPVILNVSPNGEHYNYSSIITIKVNISENIHIDNVYAMVYFKGKSQKVNLSPINVAVNGSGIYSGEFINTTVLGKYNFTLFVNDSAGHKISGNYSFFIDGIDLVINSSSMNFPNTSVEFSIVKLNITVFNTGNIASNNTNVTIWQDNYPNGILLYNETVNVPAYSSVDVTTDWTAKIGITKIIAVVDPPLTTNGSIFEMNESNNNYSKNITVNAYNLYYGNFSFDIVISANTSGNFYDWDNASGFSGNIYAIDSDSSLSWRDLYALGRNISGDYVADDFEELDLILNMTDLHDSINRTYLSGGFPKAERNFTVFGKKVINVPVINSSNNFQTGILWDSSDGGTEYDGTQDIAFIGIINQSSDGLYGKEDYEIKVPARLKQYISPNVIDTIDLYMELR